MRAGLIERIGKLTEQENKLADLVVESSTPTALITKSWLEEMVAHPEAAGDKLRAILATPITVLPQGEGASVEVPRGFDPSAIRVVGNVTGEPPFRGTLQHHGWRVKEVKLAPPPEGQDELVVMPAEVELQ